MFVTTFKISFEHDVPPSDETNENKNKRFPETDIPLAR